MIAAHAAALLDEAATTVRTALGVNIRAVLHSAASPPEGILELAREYDVSTAGVGSSSAGLLGRIALGSVTERLVHTAEVPVLLAPRGYPQHSGKIRRLTLGYGGNSESVHLLQAGAAQAEAWGTQVRIASFTVRPMMRNGSVRPTMEPGSPSREDLLIQQWEETTRKLLVAQLAEVREKIDLPNVDFEIGIGDDWQQAIDSIAWADGDVLVLGSAAAGRAAQVFLGSAAAKIMRYAPAPVMIVPRPVD